MDCVCMGCSCDGRRCLALSGLMLFSAWLPGCLALFLALFLYLVLYLPNQLFSASTPGARRHSIFCLYTQTIWELGVYQAGSVALQLVFYVGSIWLLSGFLSVSIWLSISLSISLFDLPLHLPLYLTLSASPPLPAYISPNTHHYFPISQICLGLRSLSTIQAFNRKFSWFLGMQRSESKESCWHR